MRQRTRLLGLWLGLTGTAFAGGPGRAAPAKPEKAPPSPFAVLNTDPKLRARITLDNKPETLGTLLQAVSKKAGVQVACQGDFLTRKVFHRVTDQEVREVLTQVAVLADGWWLKRAGTYWLFDRQNKTLAPFLASSDQTLTRRALDMMDRFCASLSTAQWALLSQRGLTLEDLNGPQQGWFVTAFNQEYGLHPERYTVEMWLRKTGSKVTYDAHEDALVLWMPRLDVAGVPQGEALPFLRVPVPR
jgi:hypothetical protein